MRCEVCGQSYEVEHVCTSAVLADGATPDVTARSSGLRYYLREAWRIVRWDDAAIREVMDDPRALPHGLLIWALANALPLFILLGLERMRGATLEPVRIFTIVAFTLLFGAIYGFVHMGICHLIAKYFCGGDGKFIQIIRPLLLASIVYVLLIIPIAGPIVAAIAWVAVMMMIFQEVHGMEPLTAFLISAAVGLTLKVSSYYFLHTPF
jgi:hypothetical protein